MKAELITRRRIELSNGCFIEMIAWRVPASVTGSKHQFKYRFAYIEGDVCVLRYDNEAGKGDHKHIDDREFGYSFVSLEQLIEDFLAEVRTFRK